MPQKHHEFPKSACGAIDVLYSPAMGGSEPCRESVEHVVQRMQDSGVEHVFITGCQEWACDRRIYCDDTFLDDVLRYTVSHPSQFIGLGTYNPLQIGPSVHEAETGVRQYGFRGIYVHPAGVGLALNDRRMYPLFVKALDWHVPVVIDMRQYPGEVLAISVEDMEQVASDFPEVPFVVSQCDWSREQLEHLIDVCPNVFFCFDSEKLTRDEIRQFAASLGRLHVMWGSNGQSWKQSLAEVTRLGLPDLPSILYANAMRIFRLDQRKRHQTHSPRLPRVTRIAAE